MKHLLALILIFINITSNIFGQTDTLFHLKNWEIKQYIQIYHTQKDYPLELSYYQELMRRHKNNKEYKFQVALLLLETRNYDEAKKIFYELSLSNGKYKDIASYYYALILKMQNNYNDAKNIFENLKDSKNLKENQILKNSIERQIKGIELVNDTNMHKNIYISHLNQSINKPHLEASPIILSDTSFAFYSNSRDSLSFINFDDSIQTGNFYIASLNNGVWTCKSDICEPFDIMPNIVNACFSIDKKRFYFAVKQRNELNIPVTQLYYSKKINGHWSKPQKIGNKVNLPYYNSTQPTVGLSMR